LTDEKEILKELLVDEKDVIKDLAKLVVKAKDVFVIEKSSGKIIFKNYGSLKDTARILILLIGKFFAGKLDLIEDNSMGVSEIAVELGRPNKNISGRLSELIKKGYVEKLSNRKYTIAYHRIPEIFDAIGGKNVK